MAASGDWRPVAGPAIARQRADMLAGAHRFFADRGVLLVDTPTLSRTAVSDPNVESIEVRLAVDSDAEYYLHTSPEYCMKRMLAAGFPDIAQIGKVFRDAESGARHQPEFTMIEWYRLDFGLADIIADTEDFIAALLDPSLLPRPPRRTGYREAFRRLAGVDPLDCDTRELADLVEADRELARSLGDDRDAWLDLVMTTRVAPRFERDRLTVVSHYPRSQAALARLCPDDPAVADRFEVFLGDVELANGYVELTDADEQRRRFDADQRIRRERGDRLRPLDERLLDALASGLPACAGVAVGFDRLLMLNSGSNDVRDVQHFPFGVDT